MEKITAKQFKKYVKVDPTWASHLTEDLEITGYCDLYNSKITHLSKHLFFTGGDMESDYWCAQFSNCKNLKVATGNFSGAVYFGYSDVEEIQDLKIKSNGGHAASFEYCDKLKTATGTFDGFVYFGHCGIEKISQLKISKPNVYGQSAAFVGCKKLKTATGNYSGFVDFSSTAVNAIKKLQITGVNKAGYAVKFCHCKNLKVATGNFTGHVSFLASGIQSIIDLNIAGGSPCFENCKNLKVATGIYEGFVDFSESGVESIKDLHITKGNKNGKLADFRGCNSLKVDLAHYPNYVFKGKSERRNREEESAVLLKKLSATRKKFLRRLRELGFSRVIVEKGENWGSSIDYFKGNKKYDGEDTDEFEPGENSSPEYLFQQYQNAIYPGSTIGVGSNTTVTWDLEKDKLIFCQRWGNENEDYYENCSEVVL